MTFAGGFAEANVAKPGAVAEHLFAVGRSFLPQPIKLSTCITSGFGIH